MKGVSLALLAALGSMAQNATPQRAALTGVVTGTDGRPLPGARVTLYNDPFPGGPVNSLNKEAFADEMGRYRLADVAPGVYTLVAGAEGYVTQPLGGKPGYFGAYRLVPLPYAAAPVAVTGGEIAGLDIRLTRSSTLQGRVTTAAGEFAQGIDVYAVRWTYLRGVRQLVEQGRATTDNWGAYRIQGLAPGQYFVYAVPPPDASRGGPPRRTRAATFAPNALWHGEASSITLAEGDDGSADVQLRADRPVTIRGRVSGPGGHLTAATVAIIDDADAPVVGDLLFVRSQALPFHSLTYLRPNGEFVLEGVSPGPHRIFAFGGGYQPVNMSSIWGTRGAGGRRAGEPPDVNQGYAGFVDIVTGGEDVEGIEIPLRPGGEIASKLTMDGMSYWDWARDHPGGPSLARRLPAVTLVPEAGVAIGGIFHRDADPDAGKQRVSTGRFYLEVEGSGRWYYVKSVRLGNEDVTRKPIEFAGGSAELEVVLGTDAGSLGGFVRDREGNAVPGARVSLWPVAYDLNRRDGGILRTNARHDGSFYFPLVAPGEYVAVAFADLPDPGLAEYPAFVSRLADKGVRVTVTPYAGTLASPEVVAADDVRRTLDTLQ